MERITPNFFLVGAAKAGTTSLWQYLSAHPKIFMPKNTKEPHYFLWAEEKHEFDFVDWPYIPKPYHTDWQAYLSLFNGATASAIGEASVHYLPHPTAARKIKAKAPDSRIVICLRNPVDRAWSWFRFNRMRHAESAETFEEALEQEAVSSNRFYSSQYFGPGLYAQQVERYIREFGRDRVHIILFDDLVSSPTSVCRDVFRFFGLDCPRGLNTERAYNVTRHKHAVLDPIFRLKAHQGSLGRAARQLHGVMSRAAPYRSVVRTVFDRADRFNSSINPDHHPPAMQATTRAWLAEKYSRDVEQLEQIIGRDLSAWGCQPFKDVG